MDISPERFVLGILADDAFVLVNKKIIRSLKGDGSAALFLGELISMHKYNLTNQTLDPDGFFPCLTRRILYAIGLSEYKQHRILDKFKDDELCTVSLKGFPATRYVSLNFDKIAKILATDELKYKKIDAQQFYTDLNSACNSLQTITPQTLENIERCCDNMGISLKGTLILLSKDYSTKEGKIDWTSELVGRLRQWVRNRGLGKPFDFTIVLRTLAKIPKTTSFENYINSFISQAKLTQDVHFNDQRYDYKQLL